MPGSRCVRSAYRSRDPSWWSWTETRTGSRFGEHSFWTGTSRNVENLRKSSGRMKRNRLRIRNSFWCLRMKGAELTVQRAPLFIAAAGPSQSMSPCVQAVSSHPAFRLKMFQWETRQENNCPKLFFFFFFFLGDFLLDVIARLTRFT